MNHVVLIGRLTKDPEIRYIPGNEKAVANLTLAVNRPFKKDEADFFRVVVFGKPAENCARYLGKGSMIGVQGRIQNNNYTAANGEKRYSTDIIADRVEFLDSRNKSSNRDEHVDYSSKDSHPGLPDGFETMEDDDDDIPF
ncbi:MAG: single-stranded DNA-binding protein [Peptostreptococcales bacterium]|jgi:single-strand DNA-binding protein